MASPVVLRAQAASLRRDYPGLHVVITDRGRLFVQWRILKILGPGYRVYDYYEHAIGTAREVREKIAAKEGR